MLHFEEAKCCEALITQQKDVIEYLKRLVVLLGGRKDRIGLPALVSGNEKLKPQTGISTELIILCNPLVFQIYYDHQ